MCARCARTYIRVYTLSACVCAHTSETKTRVVFFFCSAHVPHQCNILRRACVRVYVCVCVRCVYNKRVRDRLRFTRPDDADGPFKPFHFFFLRCTYRGYYIIIILYRIIFFLSHTLYIYDIILFSVLYVDCLHLLFYMPILCACVGSV